MLTIKISNNCKAIKYVNLMDLSPQKKIAIDNALERKKKYDWGLYKNRKNFFVRIGDRTLIRVKLEEKISSMDLKLSLSYLLNHNGTEGLNGLCFSEDCPLKDNPECTMKMLQCHS
jgi:hypothetical protein